MNIKTQLKGIIQLIAVIGFVILSFRVSAMLETKKQPPQSASEQDRAVFVETAHVSPSRYRITFDTTGIVEAQAEIDIIPEISGKVLHVNPQFFEGGQFAKDEILFEIDPRDYALEVERLEAEVARAQTLLTLEVAQNKAALTEWQQLNGATPAPDLVARKPQLAEAKANVKAAKAQLKNAQLDLERTKITMPFDGYVMSSLIAKGRFVTAGQSVATVYDRQAIEIRAALQDQQLAWLMGEEQADIQITATHRGQTQTYQGTLKRSTSMLDPATRFASVNFGTKESTDLLPGVFTTITIKGPELKNITRIPATAIQKGGHIWGVDTDNRLRKITPEILYQTDTYMIATGLFRPLTIVTSRMDGGADGMRITSAALKTTTAQSAQPRFETMRDMNVDVPATQEAKQ